MIDNLKSSLRALKNLAIDGFDHSLARAAQFVPKRFALMVFSHVVAVATTGKHADTELPALTVVEAAQRFHAADGKWT